MKLGGDGTELWNCGSQILKVRNCSSATFLVCNSATELLVRNIAELRRCGLKLRMPTFVYSTVNTSSKRNVQEMSNLAEIRREIHLRLMGAFLEVSKKNIGDHLGNVQRV